MQHVYSEQEAQQIVDAFPADKLEELVRLATRAQRDSSVVHSHIPILMPEGWIYEVWGNCIDTGYQDGEQERTAFFVPRITIHFKYVDGIKTEKSVLKRLPLGYCSCGKRMPFTQALLWAADMIERRGPWKYPSRMIGHIAGFFLGIHLRFSGKQQLSLQFNRHWSCL